MQAQLEIRIEDSVQVVPILKPVSIIGKKPPCDVVIAHKSVSSQHAKLIVTYNSVTIEDLGSTNGTKVRGERISAPVEVQDGDEIQMGGVVVKLLLQKEEAPQEKPAYQQRRSSSVAAKQPEILKVLSDEVPLKERIALLNKEFSSKVFVPSIHWKVRFFLVFAGAMLGCAIVVALIYMLAAGRRIDPRYLEKLREFAAENTQPLIGGGTATFGSKSLRLMQNPEIIGYYILDPEGRQLYPRADSNCPIENKGFSPMAFGGPAIMAGPSGTWYLVELIAIDGNRAGFSCLLFDRKPTSSVGVVSTALIVIVILFLLGIGYLFITFSGRIITSPIASLIVEVDELRMGQRSTLSRFEYFPEIDHLARLLEQILSREK